MLRITAQHLGPEHPDAAFPLHGLALIAAKYGKDEEAERLDRQALHIWEEQLGSEHPYIVRALHGLALLSARQGRESQAEALFGRALSIREQQLEETSLEAAEILADFAAFRLGQGRTSEAASMYQRALATREHVLGPDHQLTLDTRAHLHEALAMLGQVEEAAHVEAPHEEEGIDAVKNGKCEVCE